MLWSTTSLTYPAKKTFIPINFSEQILPGTFEYALCYIIENKLDLSLFDTWYSNDKTGAAAYSPAVMLKIILLGYAHGLVTNRRIARACETNIMSMSVSGDVQPHYTSIESFVPKMHEQIEALFTQVLMICDEEGLIDHHMFAIDGCKLKFNVCKEWSGTFRELAHKQVKLARASKRIIEPHQSQDGVSEALVVHDQKQKAKLDKSADKIGKFLATHQEKMGSKGKLAKSNITDPDSAKMITSKVLFKATMALPSTMISTKLYCKRENGAQWESNKRCNRLLRNSRRT